MNPLRTVTPLFAPVKGRHAPALADQQWAMRRIKSADLSPDMSSVLLRAWSRKHGSGAGRSWIDANDWLKRFVHGGTVAGLPRDICTAARKRHVYLDHDEISAAAEKLADAVMRSSWPYSPAPEVDQLAAAALLPLPSSDVSRAIDKETGECDRDKILAIRKAARLRGCDPGYWKRQIRAVHGSAFERFAVNAGFVSRTRALYVSDRTHAVVQARRRRSADILANLVATNEQGDQFTLQELADKSPANPVIKRAELMVRARGLEEYAKEQGCSAVFVTLTAPGHMHPRLSKGGGENPNYTGEDGRQVHEYLNTVWRRTRAQWARDGVQFFGVRTVEPHHDGTPHWHMLLFVQPGQIKTALRTFRAYSLQDSPNEKGAWLRRFTFKRIDPAKGSAVGYLAKYISKNIDGGCADGSSLTGVDHESGKSSLVESAARVGSWASTNRARQFQFFGTASVTVWRELRRLTADQVQEGLRDLFAAADASDWAQFMRLSLTADVLPYREERTNRYEEPVKVVRGITFNGEAIITRVHEWRIESARARADASASEHSPKSSPWTRVNNCTAPITYTGRMPEVIPQDIPITPIPPLTIPTGRLHPDWHGFLNGLTS